MATIITQTKQAGPDHAVLTVEGGTGAYRRKVCKECPWRKRNTGNFPPEAFKHSANTAHDMSTHTFACHMHGSDKPATCAGFLLRGAADNLAVRMAHSRDEMLDIQPVRGLHKSYRAMAIANGVESDDPALALCMPEAREAFFRGRR